MTHHNKSQWLEMVNGYLQCCLPSASELMAHFDRVFMQISNTDREHVKDVVMCRDFRYGYMESKLESALNGA